MRNLQVQHSGVGAAGWQAHVPPLNAHRCVANALSVERFTGVACDLLEISNQANEDANDGRGYFSAAICLKSILSEKAWTIAFPSSIESVLEVPVPFKAMI